MIRFIEKKHIFNRFPKIIAALILAMIMCFTLCGCDLNLPFVSKIVPGGENVFTVGSEACSDKMAKVLLLNYQKEYATLYGVDMWQHEFEDQDSLEGYVKDLTLSQLAEIYTLDYIADQQGITISEEEMSTVQSATKEYIRSLSKEEKAFLDVSEKTVEELYQRFYLAQKLYVYLTDGVSKEVSDDEARVMEMQKLCVSDLATAEESLQKIQAGTEFPALAMSVSEDENINENITKTSYDAEIIDQLLTLENGQTSDILTYEGKYYIFYCKNAYNPDLTEQNKPKVLAKRMEDIVKNTYTVYSNDLESKLHENVWNRVKIDKELKMESPSFMEIYTKYFE